MVSHAIIIGAVLVVLLIVLLVFLLYRRHLSHRYDMIPQALNSNHLRFPLCDTPTPTHLQFSLPSPSILYHPLPPSPSSPPPPSYAKAGVEVDTAALIHARRTGAPSPDNSREFPFATPTKACRAVIERLRGSDTPSPPKPPSTKPRRIRWPLRRPGLVTIEEEARRWGMAAPEEEEEEGLRLEDVEARIQRLLRDQYEVDDAVNGTFRPGYIMTDERRGGEWKMDEETGR